MQLFSLTDPNLFRSLSSTLAGVVLGYDETISISLKGEKIVVNLPEDLDAVTSDEVIDFMLTNGFVEEQQD